MEIKKITFEFNDEEIEAIHYAMQVGIQNYKKNKSTVANDWIDIAEEIRRKLPIRIRLDKLKQEKW